MSLDITPKTPANRQLVNAYGDGGFKITHVDYSGSVVVFLDNTQPWSGDLSIDGLKAVIESDSPPEILVIGCGKDFRLPPEDLRIALKKHGIVLEWMDTSAACRTFNILSIEERSVAAALIAVD